MYKAFIFDLGGVLFTNGTKNFISSLHDRYGFEKDRLKELLDGKIGSQYREGTISRDEFWQTVVTELDITEPIDSLEKQWIEGYKLIEETRDIIVQLSKTYKVYFLSDNIKERVDWLHNKYHFLDCFTDGVFSHEVGMRKPNPKIYQLALEKAQIQPKEAIFIDDKETALVPATELGMKTILFTSPSDLKMQLQAIEIKI